VDFVYARGGACSFLVAWSWRARRYTVFYFDLVPRHLDRF
jgi:hypothetical protein